MQLEGWSCALLPKGYYNPSLEKYQLVFSPFTYLIRKMIWYG